MAELGDVKMAEDPGLAKTICPSMGERAVFRRLGNTSSSREMSSAGGTRIVCRYLDGADLLPCSRCRQDRHAC